MEQEIFVQCIMDLYAESQLFLNRIYCYAEQHNGSFEVEIDGEKIDFSEMVKLANKFESVLYSKCGRLKVEEFLINKGV